MTQSSVAPNFVSPAFQRYAPPTARLLLVCALAWVAAVLVYSGSVFSRAASVPAYAYVGALFAAALPALAFVAVAFGVRFLAALTEALQDFSPEVVTARPSEAPEVAAVAEVIRLAEERLQALVTTVNTLNDHVDARLQQQHEQEASAPAPASAARGVPVIMPGTYPSFPREHSAEEVADSAEAAVLRHERHLYDGLHAISIELVRLVDVAPSPDLWRRYMRGERDAFTADFLQRFADGPVTADAYREKDDFRRMVLRYIAQYETLRERLGRTQEAAELCDFLEQSSAGRTYAALVQATADYAGAVA